MEPTYLKHLSNNEPLRSGDINSPYSYLEWKESLPSLIEKDSMERYNEYVISWFQKNKQKTVSQKFILRQKYLYMLDKLQLFFDEDSKNNWYKKVNLADEKELLLAIPYFAKKLKEISLYYLNLRKQLKNTKIKYNHVGSAQGIQQEIYRYLLEAFSSKNVELSPSVQTFTPSFSSLKDNLSIEIEELYDDKQYFDLSPTKPLSGYYDLLNDVTTKFLSTKGLTLTSADWLFNSISVPVTPDNFATLFSEMTGTLFETTDAETYSNFIEKYIAENKNVIEFLPQLSSTSTVNLFINQGNNNFFYPYGKSDTTFSVNTQLPLVPLSSIYIEGATAGTDTTNSDTIIVKYGNETKAAWLKNVEFVSVPKTVKATIKKDTSTRFIYPFPGYGLSSVDFPWTGPSIETNKEYNFLNLDLKTSVNQAYWSQVLPSDSCNSILLNNTTLISSIGVTPNVNPRFADHFYIRQDTSMDDMMPYGEVEGAWLYKFTKTSLPVSTIQDNLLLWPYTRIDTALEYPDHFTKINFSKVCNPVNITDINKASFTAGSVFKNADKIYKLEKYTDPIESALECAWLSGSVVSLADYVSVIQSGINKLNQGGVNGYRFVNQDGFSALFEAGESTRFIWTGPSHTPLNNVFISPTHRKDCPFSTNSPAVSSFDWHKCTCKQVYHAPFGHNFKSLQEGNYLADCIIEVPDQELNEFDFGSFKDLKNLPALSSLSIAWYKTRNSKANFTWGGGAWVANTLLGGQPFTLYKGKCYIYRRANVKNKNEALPSYAVRYNYYTDQTKWITARRVGTEWIPASGNQESNMIFYPGDLLRIEKQGNTTHYLLSATYSENISVNKNSIWSTFDTIPIDCGTNHTSNIQWPVNPLPWGVVDPQYPKTAFTELSYIAAWAVVHDKTHEAHMMLGQNNVIFSPPLEGTYSISVTAVRNDGAIICIPPTPGLGVDVPQLSTVTYGILTSAAGLAFAQSKDVYHGEGKPGVTYKVFGNVVDFTFNVAPKIVFEDTEITTKIPKISAVPQFQKTYLAEVDFQTPTCGFLIEHQLNGWNYSTSKSDPKASGARPYWATLDTQKTSTTRYKGIYSWGYPDEYLDDYLPNSNPVISPLEIKYGTIVEYNHKGYPFAWNQPISYQQYVGTHQWCLLSANLTQSSNLTSYDIKQNIEPIVIPYHTPTDILLSNAVDGAPLEVSYHALNSFTWPIEFVTVQDAPTPTLSSYFNSASPWFNYTNRFNPTIANIPVAEEIYSIKDVGGYFLPQRLGASQFVNKDFDIFIKDGALSGVYLTESLNIHIGGRGRTKEDQATIFDWSENNQWIKESVTTGNLAGATKKSLTKALQTFIPYQSNIDETALGLITTRSKFSPWGGPSGNEWMDKNNEPVGFTGVRNVSAWAASQVLKQSEKSIDKWTSDVYGNQYGLFKELDNVPLLDHSNTFGDLWVRTNSQNVLPATTALSAVFTPFKGLTGVDAYGEMMGNKIQIIDCYFDTLFIKTPSLCLFAKILYNYELDQIQMVFDDARWKELSPSFVFNKNWFMPTEKKLYTLFTKIEGEFFYPYLYELNIATREFKCVFESFTNKECAEIVHAKTINNASLHYNNLLNTFLITYAGTNTADKTFVIDFYIKKNTPFELSKIDLYEDRYNPEATNEPPLTLSCYLSAINIGIEPFVIPVSAINNPTSFELLNYTNQIKVDIVDGYGVFTGQLSSTGLHYVNYKVSNDIGSSIFGLTLNVSHKTPTILTINLVKETSSIFANNNDGKIIITCNRDGLDTNLQIDGGSLLNGLRFVVPTGETITIENLESAVYEIRVSDEYSGVRLVKVFVGMEGLLNVHPSYPNVIEGHSINIPFEI